MFCCVVCGWLYVLVVVVCFVILNMIMILCYWRSILMIYLMYFVVVFELIEIVSCDEL